MDGSERPADLVVAQGSEPALIRFGGRVDPCPYGLDDDDISQMGNDCFSTGAQLPGFTRDKSERAL